MTEPNTSRAPNAPNSWRATRLPLRMSIAVRPAGDLHWQTGFTLNVSRSGVLAELVTDQPPNGEVEFVLQLTAPGAFLEIADLRCRGRVVRVQRADDGRTRLAATIESYIHLPAGSAPRAAHSLW